MAESLRILGVGDAKSRHFARWAHPARRARARSAHRLGPRQPARGRARRPRTSTSSSISTRCCACRSCGASGWPRRSPASRAACSRTSSIRTTSSRTATGARAQGSGRSSSARGARTRSSTRGCRLRRRSGHVSRSRPERALAYVVNSQALEDAAVRLGADRAKFHRIFWHARIDGYSPEHADRSRWRDLGWPDDAVVCLSLRNFRPYSNLDIVLKAFAKARAEAPELRLFSSAGGGWTRTEFDRLASELGLEPYMAVKDVPAAELPSVTASADFAVSLADVDSSPASLLETMASGVPLIVGRAPSMEEWIQQGEGGEVDGAARRGRGRSCDGAARARRRAAPQRTASGTSARCTRASATRPRSSSRSTARCWAGEARPRARLRRRRLRARPAPHGRGKAADDLAARARGCVRAAPLDRPRVHADRLVDLPHRPQSRRPRHLQLHDEPEPRHAEARERREPRPAHRSGGRSAQPGSARRTSGSRSRIRPRRSTGSSSPATAAPSGRRSCRRAPRSGSSRRIPTSSRRITRWRSAGGRTSPRTPAGCSSTRSRWPASASSCSSSSPISDFSPSTS